MFYCRQSIDWQGYMLNTEQKVKDVAHDDAKRKWDAKQRSL